MATFWIATSLSLLAMTSGVAGAAINIPFTINLSENVTVTGTPRIAIDVGGNTRYATYTSGTGTNALTFTLSPDIGDVDLDGVTVSSPIDLNGGTIKDTAGNDATLTFTPPNTSGIKINYPSLGMDFTNGTTGRYTLNGTAYNSLSSFLSAAGGTFARNSIATYYDSTGILQTASANTPRFDYDPVTHAEKGILIEENRTNLLSYSAELENAAWNSHSLTVTANATISPDGTLSAESVVATGASLSYISKSGGGSPISAGQTYTLSIYAKAGTSSRIIFENPAVTFNISTATLSAVGADVSATITAVGNGWYRLTATRTFNSGTTTGNVIYIDQYGVGSAGKGVYLWGAQFEQGAFPTSYIPTTTAAVTRAADTFSVPAGAWYHSSSGTLLSEADTLPYNASLSGALSVAFFHDGTANNQWGIRYDTGGTLLGFPFWSAGTNQTTLNAGAVSDFNKAVHALSAGTRSVERNTGAVMTGSFSTVPSINKFDIGSNNASNYLNGWIKNTKYYPARVRNGQLQLLTQ